MAQVGSALVCEYRLEASELEAVDEILQNLVAEFGSPVAPAFQADGRRFAYRLPAGLLQFVERFRTSEVGSAIAVTGLNVDDQGIGPTPSHWNAQPDASSTLREETFLVMLAHLLGDLYGWATLQNGRLIQNVLPIRDQAYEQSGHGSLATLAWHTEDGFHPYRCDYLGLLGLRNHGRVATTMATVDDVRLTPDQYETLSQARFIIHPDNEHLEQRHRDAAGNVSPHDPLPDDWTSPKPVPVLFGELERPYLRIDPIFMSSVSGDTQAESALASIVGQLEGGLRDFVIGPGTVCFIDNFRAVHGRKAFRSSFDGRDRWLKKVLVARDLRKSRPARQGPDGRIVQPTMLAGATGAGR